jgi:preprotein translocase subunit Sss1
MDFLPKSDSDVVNKAALIQKNLKKVDEVYTMSKKPLG